MAEKSKTSEIDQLKDSAWAAIREFSKTHYGRRPDRLLIHPANQGYFDFSMSIPTADGLIFILFGVPVEFHTSVEINEVRCEHDNTSLEYHQGINYNR